MFRPLFGLNMGLNVFGLNMGLMFKKRGDVGKRSTATSTTSG